MPRFKAWEPYYTWQQQETREWFGQNISRKTHTIFPYGPQAGKGAKIVAAGIVAEMQLKAETHIWLLWNIIQRSIQYPGIGSAEELQEITDRIEEELLKQWGIGGMRKDESAL